MLSCFGTLAFGQNKNWWELNSQTMCAARNRRREKAQEQCSRPCEAMNQMCRSEIWIWKLDSTGHAGLISLVADLSIVNVLCMCIAYSNIHCFLILNKIDIVLYCWLDADGVWDNREWPASFPFNDPSSDIHSALLTPLSEWPVNLWTQIKILSYQSYAINSGTARYSKKEVGNRGSLHIQNSTVEYLQNYTWKLAVWESTLWEWPDSKYITNILLDTPNVTCTV